MGLCSLDQGAGGGARALPTRTLSREQHCSRIDVETQRACFRGCARDMPHARNGAVQSHMRCEAVRMHLAPVLLHGELKNWIGRTNGAGAAFEAVARATTTTMMLVSRGLPLGRLDVGFGRLGSMLVSWARGVGDERPRTLGGAMRVDFCDDSRCMYSRQC